MEYRKLPHGEEQISILGLGTSSLGPLLGTRKFKRRYFFAVKTASTTSTWPQGTVLPLPPWAKPCKGCGSGYIFKSTLEQITKPGSTAGPRSGRDQALH